jgi:PhoH-like ATPase
MKTKRISRGPKTFILDTNVILHDASSIHNFEENDVLIPLPVIEELDHFKRGSQVINLNAREFARTLDSLTGTAIFNGGVSMGKGKGKVKIAISRGLSNEIKEIFKEDTPDHRILSIALDWNKKGRENSTILVTKDVNLRMKAKALGILSEDYTTDRIGNVEELYSGKEIIENFDDELIIKFFQIPFEVPAEEILSGLKGEILPNKYYILTGLYLHTWIKIKRFSEKLIKMLFTGLNPAMQNKHLRLIL